MACYLTWFPWIFPKWSIFMLLGLQEMCPPNWWRMSLSHFMHLYTLARLAKWPRAGSGLVSVKAKINLQYRRLWILSFLSWRPSTSQLEKRFASLDRSKSHLRKNINGNFDPSWHAILIHNATFSNFLLLHSNEKPTLDISYFLLQHESRNVCHYCYFIS